MDFFYYRVFFQPVRRGGLLVMHQATFVYFTFSPGIFLSCHIKIYNPRFYKAIGACNPNRFLFCNFLPDIQPLRFA